MGLTLYVGGDESNHGNLRNGRNEIFVATFSLEHEDSIVRQWPNLANHNSALEWLENGGSYRHTARPSEIYSKAGLGISIVMPTLIKNYLENSNINDLDRINIYLDGKFEKNEKNNLKKDMFSAGFYGHIGVYGFPKKKVLQKKIIKGNEFRRKRKICRCPKIVWMAHNLANLLNCEYKNYWDFKNFVGPNYWMKCILKN